MFFRRNARQASGAIQVLGRYPQMPKPAHRPLMVIPGDMQDALAELSD
jgi:hypothetical protein